MSADSDALDRLIVSIVSVKRRLGTRAYRAALAEARKAVAALVLREAEKRAGLKGGTLPPGIVVAFPKAVRAAVTRAQEDDDIQWISLIDGDPKMRQPAAIPRISNQADLELHLARITEIKLSSRDPGRRVRRQRYGTSGARRQI